MAAFSRFGWNSFITRFLFALVVVFASYNPEGWSYFHWIRADFPSFSVFKLFAGIVLLIGWVILIRATLGSLGSFGILLAIAFFGLLTWLIFDVFDLRTTSLTVISYIVEVMVASVLSVGVSWSHIRRRISGQVDTDELEQDL